jgi:hypothetical protein
MSKTKKIPSSFREAVASFRQKRLDKDDLEKEIKDDQPALIAQLQELGIDNQAGLIYNEDDEEKGAAYIQQNRPGEYWDEQSIREYLRRRKSLWMACSSRVLDIQKWETEVRNGNVPPNVAKTMKVTGNPSAPFIRFGKITRKCR